jgi:hypothetical protein
LVWCLVVLGAVFGAVRVLGGAKQTSKGLAWCRVLSKGVKFGVKFNKQGLGAWCCVWCRAVLSKQAKVWCKGLVFCLGAKQDR